MDTTSDFEVIHYRPQGLKPSAILYAAAAGDMSQITHGSLMDAPDILPAGCVSRRRDLVPRLPE